MKDPPLFESSSEATLDFWTPIRQHEVKGRRKDESTPSRRTSRPEPPWAPPPEYRPASWSRGPQCSEKASLFLKGNVEHSNTYDMIKSDRPGEGHSAAAAGTSSLGALRALERIPDPAKQAQKFFRR
eukprot:8989045-Pyramimonas_sp.AAC.1